MKILISDIAYIYAAHKDQNYFKRMAGKWLKVETDYLFNNQYNTATHRIMDSQVSAVKDDARKGRGVCQYCEAQLVTGETCIANKECADYGIKWFTPDNTFFLKYPNGLQQPGKEFLSIHEDAIKLGTYYLENHPSLGYYRLYNCRQTINFKFDGTFYYVANGIGYTQNRTLTIPEKVQKQLPKAIAAISAKTYNYEATVSPLN